MTSLRLLESVDLPAVAAVHLAAFPDTAISAFGEAAAFRFYASLLDGHHDAVGIGALEDGELVGFCFVGVWRGAEAHFLWRNLGFLVWQAAKSPDRLRIESVRKRAGGAVRILLRTLGRPARAVRPGEPARPRMGIQSIAVRPGVQRRGVGRLLHEACLDYARSRGANAMILSVHPSNERAVRFYDQLGWCRSADGDGTWRGVMIRDIA